MSGFFLVLLSFNVRAATQSVLELHSHQPHWSLAGYLSVGPQDDATPVAELFRQGHHFTLHSAIPSWGFSHQPRWLRFTLKAHFSDSSEWYLDVAPVFTDSLLLYWQDEEGQIQQMAAGDLLRAKERPLNLPRQVFPLRLAAGEERTYLLRLAGTNPLFADIRLWSPNAYLEETQSKHFFISAYLAILVLMSVLGVIYTLLLKDRVHFFYTCYVIAQLGFQLPHTGYLGWLTNLPWTRFPDLLASASIVVSLSFFALLFIHLTRMKQDFPRLSLYFQRTALLVTLVGLIAVGFDRYILVSPWIQLYILLLTAFAVSFSLYRLARREYRLGSAYLVIFGVLALGVVLRILREQSLLPNNFWTENAMYLGTLVHLLAMQLLIITGINQTRKNNERELERRVAERTTELQERNAQLLKAHQENLQLQAGLEKSLEQENRIRLAQQDFLLMVSNEFRTPLTVIDGTLTLLDMQPQADVATRSSWLERIRGAQQRLVSLVDTTLWDQRLGDESWQPSRVNLNLLPWMIQLTENLRRMYNDKVLVFLGRVDVQLNVDPEILQMLLQSLVDTLVYYLPAGSQVVLDLEEIPEQLVISVGTPDKDLLPELSGQLQKRYSNEHSRQSGAGLYLARAAAIKLGGDLEYQLSEQGARFVVTLPKETTKKV